MFGQLLNGSYGFSDKNGNGTPVDEILAGNYSTFVKNYLADGVSLADSAGTWKYTQISPFLQDTWQVNDNLSIVYGVRVNIPKADHAPPVAVESSTNTPPGATAGAPRAAPPSWNPQLLQNRMCVAFALPHRGHTCIAGAAGAPSLWRAMPVGGVGIFPGRSGGTQSPSRCPQSWQ